MRRSRAIQKKNMPFWAFFYVQPKKNQNDATIFVNIEGFRPCLSKLSYRAPKWALMIRLVQKERLKSPKKSLIIENQASGVILEFWPKQPFWSFWLAISEPGWTRRQKVPLGVMLKVVWRFPTFGSSVLPASWASALGAHVCAHRALRQPCC